MDSVNHNSTAETTVAGLPSQGSSTLGRWIRLCLKELRETLRDRRTIVTLVFMPLLVYPLLSMAFQKLMFTSLPGASQVDCRVGVDSERDAARLQRVLALGDAILSEAQAAPGSAARVPNTAPLSREPKVTLVTGPNVQAGVAAGVIDAAVVVREAPPIDPRSGLRRQFHCEVIYRSDSALSKATVDYIQRRLRAVNEHYVSEQLGFPLPTKIELAAISGTGADLSVTTLVPLILILMTITGAVYPAIDLTAGERERGTLETLMAAPVPRLSLLLAKYVAVLTVTLFTATANLAAMMATLVATGLADRVFGDRGLTSQLVSQVFALLILFAAFFSAILLAITSFARSFKEAQAYLIPLMLLALAPGIMSLMPELRFNGTLAVTPLVNIVLLARDLLEGTADPRLAAVAVVSTLLYAVAAVAIAARIFGADAILYGSQASWTDLLSRAEEPRDTATVPGAVFCLALIFPPYFLIGNLLHRQTELDMAPRLMLSASATALLFAVIPLLAAWLQRTHLRSGFRLQGASVGSFLAAAILGFSLWPLAHEVYLINELLGIGAINQQRLDAVKQLLDQWRTLSPWLILLTMAIVPAVCEELFFRGYLLAAFLQKETLRPWQAIALSAVLFGAFHIVATSALSAERFLPSTFLGLVLGYVCYRSGSVWPGMLLHACHNGLLLMMVYYRDELAARGWGVQEQQHLPALWLGFAIAFVIAAFALLALSTRRPASFGEALEPQFSK